MYPEKHATPRDSVHFKREWARVPRVVPTMNECVSNPRRYNVSYKNARYQRDLEEGARTELEVLMCPT